MLPESLTKIIDTTFGFKLGYVKGDIIRLELMVVFMF